MQFERTITVQEPEATIRNRVMAYLEQAGYRPVVSAPLVIYQRGSVLGSWAGFSPTSWQANATVHIAPGPERMQVSVVLDVNTSGQWMTGKECSFWERELDGLEVAVRGGVIDLAHSVGVAKSSSVQNWLSYVLILVLTVGLGVWATFAWQISFAGCVGAEVGFVISLVIVWLWLRPRRGRGK